MSNPDNERIEQIDKEIERLGPEISKGKYIAGVAIWGGVAIVGFTIFIVGLFYYVIFKSAIDHSYGGGTQPDFVQILNVYLAMIIIGGIAMALGAIFAPISGHNLKMVVRHNKKLDTLTKEKKSLQTQPVADDIKESNEDTLLRLLSEGKISVEEYKRLSKK